MNDAVKTALLLTTLAGLSTSIGSVIALFVKKPSNRFMGFTLGFSAGVMVLVSMVELFPQATAAVGFLKALIWFIVGMGVFLLIDMLIPHDYIGQHDHSIISEKDSSSESKLKRTGMLVAIGIGVHNLPEGMVTFTGAMHDVHLGVALAVAIAIHNIPEGLAVSAPVYAATGSRSKAFMWSLLSGVSEPVGAAIAALFMYPFMSDALMGATMAAVAGIMVAISLDELIPVAKSYDTEHVPIIGIMLGMLVMGISLVLLKVK